METCDDNPGLPPPQLHPRSLKEPLLLDRAKLWCLPGTLAIVAGRTAWGPRAGGGPGPLRETWHLSERQYLTAVPGWGCWNGWLPAGSHTDNRLWAVRKDVTRCGCRLLPNCSWRSLTWLHPLKGRAVPRAPAFSSIFVVQHLIELLSYVASYFIELLCLM